MQVLVGPPPSFLSATRRHALNRSETRALVCSVGVEGWTKVPSRNYPNNHDMLQQKSSILPAGHPVQQMQGLAKTLALPGMFSPSRFPSFPALERTAVMGFSAPVTLSVAVNSSTHLMACRQAAWPMWADQLDTQLLNCSYAARYMSDSLPNTPATTANRTYVFHGAIFNWTAGASTATSVDAGVNGVAPPFAYPVLGMDGETSSLPWVYAPANGCTVFVVGNPNAAYTNAESLQITYEIWSSKGEAFMNTLAATIAAGTRSIAVQVGTLGEGQWIRPVSVTATSAVANTPASAMAFAIVFVNTTTYTFSASASTMGSVGVGGTTVPVNFFPLVYPVEFKNSQLPWYSTRVTAVSALCTNTTQVLNKGGTVLAGRVQPQVLSPWAVDANYINGLHPAEKAFLPLETGLYTYCPPSSDMASFFDYTLPTGGVNALTPYCPVYRLDNDSLVNHAFVSAPVAATLAITVDWHVEFRTSSALFPIGLSTLTLESLHQAQIILAGAGFFFENPEHKAVLEEVVDAAKKYGPSLLSFVSPAAGRAAAAGVKMLSSKPKNTMKATSAANSGIVSKPQPKPKKGKGQKPKKGKKR